MHVSELDSISLGTNYCTLASAPAVCELSLKLHERVAQSTCDGLTLITKIFQVGYYGLSAASQLYLVFRDSTGKIFDVET